MSTDDVVADYLESGDEALLAGVDPATANDARAVRALLADEAMWDGPSVDLLERIERDVATTPQVVDVPDGVDGADGADDRDGVVSLADRRAHRDSRGGSRSDARRRTLPWVTAVAGVAAGLLLAVVIATARGGDEGTSTRVALAASPSSGISAHADIAARPSGFEIVLDVDGLPRAPAGSFYQAWLKGPKGLVAIGTFHTGGEIVLWSGVDPRDYPTMTVTIEPEDGNAASSGKRVLVGEIGEIPR